MAKETEAFTFRAIINLVNYKIEQYSLKKILIIIGVFWAGLIVFRASAPVITYDCSEKAEIVSQKILACEQQKIDERIKEKELELDKFKVEKNYEIAEFKAFLKTVDFKDPGKTTKRLKDNLNSYTQRLEKMNDSCSEKMIESMCKIVKQ